MVYIYDVHNEGTLTNAQLDLTLQYKDTEDKEIVKHINMKREDVHGKTRGKIFSYPLTH